jgi:hypothetical protein
MAKSNDDVKIGDIILVLANSNSNNYPIGRPILLTTCSNVSTSISGRYKVSDNPREYFGNNLMKSDFVILDGFKNPEDVTAEKLTNYINHSNKFKMGLF